MSALGSDRIYVVPPGRKQSYYAVADGRPAFWHQCPGRKETTTREALDPMALGTCRYCGERLPEPTS